MIPRISPAEWAVMEVVWKRHPILALEVVEELKSLGHDWQDQTIRTMLRRLVRKKALTFQPDGNGYLYSPAVARAQCAQAESKSFLGRVLGGAVQPLIVQLVQEAKLSAAEIAELRRILRDKERK